VTRQATATRLQVEVICTGEIPTPYNYVFRADGGRLTQLRKGLSKRDEMLRSPCLAYVVRHPRVGTVLIDTGFHRDASVDLRKDFGPAMGFMFSGLRPSESAFDEQLQALHVKPEEVEQVVMTHLHVDHTSGMRLVPNATFICTRQEWSAAKRRFASANGYVAHHLPASARVRLLDLERDGEQHDAFDRTVDLFGDGSFRLLWTPGHTKGHQSILLSPGDGREVLVVGDAAYTLRSIERQQLPMLTADDDASRRSLAQLKSFADAHPDAIVIPTHDPDAWRAP
jgi:glyoxylase-like metal-dependent hydrolase (beta-lactamase superfamily II)